MGTKLTQDEFIERCRKIHRNKYDYSKTIYKHQQGKIIIICPIHGEFEQKSYNHLIGRGCSNCVGKNKNDKDIIEQFKKIHGDKYDYSKVHYTGIKNKLLIICNEHGEFKQLYNEHIKHDCPKCKGKYKSTKSVINEFRKTHGNKYDYSLVNYINSKIKVIIICPKHGRFEQTPDAHIRHQGCIKCSGLNKLTTEEFIEKSKIIHNNFYNYSEVNYIIYSKKVKIICPKHGEFIQTPSQHLKGHGCKKCGGNEQLTTKEFIEKSKIIHKDIYNYYFVDYISTHLKVIIYCNKHGKFDQSPANHLKGKGCPKCKQSKGEIKIYNYLTENNIKFDTQKTFNKCKDIRMLKFDFYLMGYNICIEFDGEQHFQKCWFDKNNTRLIIRQKRDLIKTTFCQQNDIKLIRIKFDENIEEKLQWIMNYLKTQKELI